MFLPRRRPRRRPRPRLIKFAPAIVSTTVVTGLFVVRDVAEQGNVLRQRLKNPGLDCRRINMASGVRTRIKQGHTTLRRTVAHAYACIRDHRQLLAAACHNLFKRHGSPTSTYNWNTPNIYIYLYIYMHVCWEQFSSFVRTLNPILLWLTNDKRRSNAPDKKSAVDKEPLLSE